MISLKPYLKAHPNTTDNGALGSLRQILLAIGKTTAVAMPVLGSDLEQKLTGLSDQLAIDSSGAEIARSQQQAQSELELWGIKACGYLKRKTEEVKEIVAAVARTGDAIGERNERYIERLDTFTSKLQAIANLDDIGVLRESVIKSASELNVCVGEIKAESEHSVAELRAEIDTFRTRLEETERRASIDVLTGQLNRSAVEREIETRIRFRQVFSVILIDLNGFKLVNDAYGHAAGDDLLRSFAAELRSNCRAIDIVGRWGGDEFLVVADLDLKGANNLREHLTRWALGEYRIQTANGPIKLDLTAALGVAQWNGTESIAGLIGRSDALMYEQKKVNTHWIMNPEPVLASRR